MQAGTLLALTKIAMKVSNQSSLTALYRSIELGTESMRCCSEFGNIELWIEPTGLTLPALFDTVAVNSVASTLPAEADITFSEQQNQVLWKCGRAKGHWNVVQSDHKIPQINHTNFPWLPPETLADALELAASSCQQAAVSIGLYGITVEPEGNILHLLSSNSTSLASVRLEKGTFPGGKVTLKPPVPAVIAALLRSCKGCALDITPDGIFIFGEWLAAHLPLGVTLDHDLKEIASRYDSTQHTAKIDNDAVKKFITRARALSDRHTSFNISIRVESGHLFLEHRGISSSTEEFFLADGLPTDLKYTSVSLPADALLIPLSSIDLAVFDYLPQQQLILKGSTPDFMYIVGAG